MKRCLAVLPLICVMTGAALAQTAVTPDKDLPKSGQLSSTFVTGRASSSVPEPFGFDELNRTEQSPITGSVSRGKPGFWELKIFNNSKDATYSVDVEVRQLDESLRVVKRDYYSSILPPNSSKTQSITDGMNTKGAELELTKYTNLTAKKNAVKK